MPPHHQPTESGTRLKAACAGLITDVPRPRLWREILTIGGDGGWYYSSWLWSLRGTLDRLVGGVGMRGRRHPAALAVGDVIDFMRVAAIEPESRLLLTPEMRMPGRGALEFRLGGLAEGHTRLSVSAQFEPAGLAGRLYWGALLPIHTVLFRGLARAVVRRARNAV